MTIALRKINDAIRIRESTTLTWPQICERLNIPARKLEVLLNHTRDLHPGLSRRNRFGRYAVAISHLSGRTLPEICDEYGVTPEYVVAAIQEHAANTNRRT
jgi:hypothetical protein